MNISIDLRIAANRPAAHPDHGRRISTARALRQRALLRHGDHVPMLGVHTPAVPVKNGRALFDHLRRERLTPPESRTTGRRHGSATELALGTARSPILEEDSPVTAFAGHRPC